MNVARLQARINQLEGEKAVLQHALLDKDEVPADWRLTLHESRLVACLIGKIGKVVSRDQILDALYFDKTGTEPDPKIIDQFVHRARRKLIPFDVKIVTHRGRGWSIEGHK